MLLHAQLRPPRLVFDDQTFHSYICGLTFVVTQLLHKRSVWSGTLFSKLSRDGASSHDPHVLHAMQPHPS